LKLHKATLNALTAEKLSWLLGKKLPSLLARKEK
jgi:hypothetical protein